MGQILESSRMLTQSSQSDSSTRHERLNEQQELSQLSNMQNDVVAGPQDAQQAQIDAGGDQDWLQVFRSKGLTPEQTKAIKEVKDIQREVLEGYYGRKMEKMELTGERAPPELRAEIKKREFTVREWIINEKGAPVLAGTNDLQDERQTQVIAIHRIKMTKAGITQLIYDDKRGVMNSLPSPNHAMRIIAGDAQQRQELAIVPQIAREVLKSGGGVTTLLGYESRKKVEDVMKHAKLISTKENTLSTPGPINSVNELQLQQQVTLFNR
ncbi:MAG: hypothetical protein EZS28_038606 [Streblomastix strix]|uniref:Uncharacterized protein n=1 Tax=Streblomastix strix TaxID=222440 RepID=A0A5J4U5K2_9EUKA|nr:MAG: hypothetical protein EZS28_038606 [Streblomastix strix]